MQPAKKQLFLSYARADRAAADRLVQAFRILRCEVWRDDSLSGGQEWWDVIIENIISCDAFVLAVSPDTAESIACRRELEYALALGKTILPVVIANVGIATLPARLAAKQLVDLAEDSQDAGLRLAVATLDIVAGSARPSYIPEAPTFLFRTCQVSTSAQWC